MATFLQLVNEVERESGTISQGQELTTVVGASGRQRKIVNWVRQAWEMIQRDRRDWTFRRKQFDDILSTRETSYTTGDLGIDDFGGWIRPTETMSGFSVFDPAIGKADETRLRQIPIRDWMSLYDLGAPQPQRPQYVAIGPDNELRVGPPADKPYILRGWYIRAIQSLATDGDTPFINPDYHAAIVWRALVIMGEDDEAPFEVASSMAQYRAILSAMLREYTDPVEL